MNADSNEIPYLDLVLPEHANAIIRRLLEVNPSGTVQSLLEAPLWPPEIKAGQAYARAEDASEDGLLTTCVGQNGDVAAVVRTSRRGLRTGVEFKTREGGGQSPRVTAALLLLAEAIRLDNALGSEQKRPG